MNLKFEFETFLTKLNNFVEKSVGFREKNLSVEFEWTEPENDCDIFNIFFLKLLRSIVYDIKLLFENF